MLDFIAPAFNFLSDALNAFADVILLILGA